MLQVLPQTEVLFSQDEVQHDDTAAREELRAAVIEVCVLLVTQQHTAYYTTGHLQSNSSYYIACLVNLFCFAGSKVTQVQTRAT